VTFPTSFTFAAGATKATFPITTSWVTAPTTVTMYVTMNGLTLSGSFVIEPVVPNQFNLGASSVTSGSSTTGQVYLSGPSPAGGAVVQLSSNNPAVTVPASMTIPAGWYEYTFPINTSAVSTATPVVITATFNGGSMTATLTLNPASPKKTTTTTK
jgi:hypothetical protein